MSNQVLDLLRHWSANREGARWVLGTIYETVHSSYRKAGAMMLFNDLGQQFGMLSGGCLDAELHRRARQVMESGRALCVRFDSTDEDDLSYQFGLGCGGVVHILLQPLSAENDLDLGRVQRALDGGAGGWYRQLVSEGGEVAASFVADKAQYDIGAHHAGARARLVARNGGTWLETWIQPPPHLLIIGGGPDALPLMQLALQLGWQVSVQEDRPAFPRGEIFVAAERLVRVPLEQAAAEPWFAGVNAAVVMTHHVERDAAALAVLGRRPLQYLALIGPAARATEVLRLAGIEREELATPLHAPAGVDIGGELPESVALSILTQCHAVLCGGSLVAHSDAERAARPIHPSS